MSSTNTRFLVAYALLVGLPLLGLAGALKTGRKLTAPISVNGAWKLEIDDHLLTSQPCLKAITSLQHSAMVISQSGKQFALNFGAESKLPGSGTISGLDLSAEVATSRAGAETACGGNGVLSIAATLDPKTASVMSGTISVNDCSSCSPVKFQAELQTLTGRRETR
jgi:hypothetical protein